MPIIVSEFREESIGFSLNTIGEERRGHIYDASSGTDTLLSGNL